MALGIYARPGDAVIVQTPVFSPIAWAVEGAGCRMIENPMKPVNGRYELDRLTRYDVWFAQYSQRPTMYYNYRIWQYTDSGSVPGISGKVDMDLAFIPY